MRFVEEILARATLVKGEEPEVYGRSPYERPIEEHLQMGFILLDKPRGPSSHEIVAWIKKLMGIKAGHGGTLEPL